MIFITGDTHIPIDVSKLNTHNWPEQKSLTKNDFLIVCGDFGLIWNYKETPSSIPELEFDNCWTSEEIYWYRWLNEKTFTTLWVDGNHECLHKDTDILTSEGWMNVVEAYNKYPNIEIASVDMSTGEISFTKPLKHIKKYSESIIEFIGMNYGQCVTPKHEVIFEGEKTKAENLIGRKFHEKSFKLPVRYSNEYIIDDALISVMVAIVMDGTIADYNKRNPNSKKVRIQFHLKCKDKIDYIQRLLNKASIKHTVRYYDKDASTIINIYGDDARFIYYDLLHKKKTFPKEFYRLSASQFTVLMDVISKTDGTRTSNKSLVWRSTDRDNVDIVQALCVLHGYDIHIAIKDNASGYTDNAKRQYVCYIKQNKLLDRFIEPKQIEYNDYAFCFTMKDGTLITRYQDRVCITGNCYDRLKKYPVEEWHGGKVQKISDSIIHLMRGQVFELNGKTIFTMGGAESHDRGYATGTEKRDAHKTWWKEEIPLKKEWKEAEKNLNAHDRKVDYIITHEAPGNVRMNIGYEVNGVSNELWRIRDTVEFDRWYCGHLHRDELFGKVRVLYYDIVEAGE